MRELIKNLSNIIQILSEIEELLQSQLNDNIVGNEGTPLEEKLRALNFESNDFFEKLSSNFDIGDDHLGKIMKKLSNIIQIADKSDKLFEFKINLLNLQIFLPIHLLFSLSTNELKFQLEKQHFLESLVSQIQDFDEIPRFQKVLTLQEKHILDNYLRILGSSGDLYYLLCSNLSLLNENFLVNWSNRCFKRFYLLDLSLEKFDPLDFYYSNNIPVEDFYREIVGHYTILGNTNATNLLEFLLSLDNNAILHKIDFKPYIEQATIDGLENKLQMKSKKIKDLLDRVNENKRDQKYFSLTDDPMNVISFKLMIALEKYFDFTISKIRTYEKEYNQLNTPASTELKTSLELCEDWLDTTLSLTESNENILDTPFGGLFNSVFLEYLLLLALDDGKIGTFSDNKVPNLEVKLEKYKHIFINDHSLEAISDFIYVKTYAQIYVYASSGKKEPFQDLTEEIFSLIQYLDKRPFLKLNSLMLLLVLQISLNIKTMNELSDLKKQILDMTEPSQGLRHMKEDVVTYLHAVEKQDFHNLTEKLLNRSKPKILDINSWLLPNFSMLTNNSNENELKFLSFNQLYDRIISQKK